jgi:predicted nucleic acid-binding protein
MVLLDTSFIIALENRADPHHERAKTLDRQLLQENAALLETTSSAHSLDQ